MRVSRWGQSPYETEEDIATEAAALAAYGEVLPFQSDAEVVILHSKVRAGPALLESAPSLRLLITTTSGTDHIDLDAMAHAGVRVCRLPLARRDAVVEASIGMLTWGLRGFGVMDDWAREGVWGRSNLPHLAPRLIRGSRIGLVGLGVIGMRAADQLLSMGAEVWGLDPRGLTDGVKSASLEEMLGGCDAVSLHCDLNPSSEGLISSKSLTAAHAGLVLVNTARGGLVDVESALSAIEHGRLSALCLDVFPQEPVDLRRFASHERVFVSPHSAGYHTGLSRLIREGLIRAVAAWAEGRTLPHSVL